MARLYCGSLSVFHDKTRQNRQAVGNQEKQSLRIESEIDRQGQQKAVSRGGGRQL